MIVIPESELEYRATRAGGPGGQHVNKTASRVELRWNVRRSAALTEAERDRLLSKLATRLDQEGDLRVVAATTRSQLRNKHEALARLLAMVEQALKVPKPRKKTRTPASERENRLAAKRQRSVLKANRRVVPGDE